LNIAFDGDSYDEPWRLYDVELDVNLPKDEASILLLQEGGVFMVRHRDRLWRVLGNVPNMLDRLPEGTKVGRIYWESKFEIANKVASKFVDGPFYLAGDAAHVHAGIGARGMNLGIEDAYVFARLLHTSQLQNYETLRHATVLKVVSQIRKAMGAPRPKTLPGRLVRSAPWLVPIVFAFAGPFVERWILGLDHDIDL
ncbi:MAG: FAD-dependent monooxygenase, partial [Proteobacteria bacterium]|nr:FAD-dependent monooxygenase [Pseudomonadota bacterium]